jgi:hypothetical protein
MRRCGDGFGQQLQKAALHLIGLRVEGRASEMIGQDVVREAGVGDVWASVPLLRAADDAKFVSERLREAEIIYITALGKRAVYVKDGKLHGLIEE